MILNMSKIVKIAAGYFMFPLFPDSVVLVDDTLVVRCGNRHIFAGDISLGYVTTKLNWPANWLIFSLLSACYEQ